MKNRTSQVIRKTQETDISVNLNVDGKGIYTIETPIRFFNHMLEQFARHGLFDLIIKAKGHSSGDGHHIVEDAGLTMGEAFLKALGDKKGINRYGFFILPMDDVLVTTAVDFSGRSSLCFDCVFKGGRIGDMPTELIYDFWKAFMQNAKMNLFIKTDYGRNDHHKAEALFKCIARSFRMASEIDKRDTDGIPSTKGIL